MQRNLLITEPQRIQNISVADRFVFIQGLDISLRNPDTQDYEIFLLQTGFCFAQLPLTTDFSILLVITPATNEVLLTAR